MKLEINLADREEVGAAVALLQVIYDNTQAPAPALTPQPLAPLPPLQSDPAAVFGGGAAAPAPLPAVPSFAVAAPLPTAPEGMPATTSAATSSAPLPPAPPAPLPGAPVALGAGSLPPVGSVEVDSTGLPWDGRIHASTKSKVQSGAWTLKRGVDKALVATVETELRARLGAGAPAAPAAPAAPVAPVAQGDPTTFEALMPRVTAAVVAGTVPATALNQVCANVGLPSLVALQQQQGYVPMVWATLKQTYPGLQ